MFVFHQGLSYNATVQTLGTGKKVAIGAQDASWYKIIITIELITHMLFTNNYCCILVLHLVSPIVHESPITTARM